MARGRPRGRGRGRGGRGRRGRARGRARGRGRPPTNPPPEQEEEQTSQEEEQKEEKKEGKVRVDDEDSEAELLVKLFDKMTTPAMLNTIRQETKVIGIIPRRQRSETLLESMRNFIEALPQEKQQEFDGCKNAELGCIITLLENLSTPETIIKIIPKLQLLWPILYQAPRTLNTNYTVLKNAIKKKFAEYPDIIQKVDKELHISLEAATELKIDYNASVFQRNAAQREISMNEVLQFVMREQYSDDWKTLMMVVALAVGSRMVEIAQVSDYKPPDPPANPHFIKIIGVAKDTGEERPGIQRAELSRERILNKPVFGLVAADIIRIVSLIRTEFHDKKGWAVQRLPDGKFLQGGKHMTNQAVTNNINQAVNNTVKEKFGDDYTFHKLRAMYAELVWNQWGPTSKMSKTAYYSNVLGHQPTSLITALSYQQFAVTQQLEQVDPSVKAMVTNLGEEFKAFKKELEKKGVIEAKDDTKAVFTTSEGDVFEVTKHVRTMGEDLDTRLKDIQQKAEILEGKGLKITYANMLKLGYGTDIIKKLKELRQKEGKEKKQASRPKRKREEVKT